MKASREVFTEHNLDNVKLDVNDRTKALKHYYAVRSNFGHRGKCVVANFQTVKTSLEDLFAIFKGMLDDASSRQPV